MGYQYRGKLHDIDEPIEQRTEAKCGTNSGYARHIQQKTPKCQPCKDAHAVVERVRRHRPKARIQCATYPGYMRHKRADETPCELCLDAYAQYMRDYRERRAA